MDVDSRKLSSNSDSIANFGAAPISVYFSERMSLEWETNATPLCRGQEQAAPKGATLA